MMSTPPVARPTWCSVNSVAFNFPREEPMTQEVDNSRRRMLTTVTSGVGLIGAGAMAVPFVASMAPSARAKAAGA
ncbi:uncharacterized protein METZ01_LOCUS109538, partial [marine metagenome]